MFFSNWPLQIRKASCRNPSTSSGGSKSPFSSSVTEVAEARGAYRGDLFGANDRQLGPNRILGKMLQGSELATIRSAASFTEPADTLVSCGSEAEPLSESDDLRELVAIKRAIKADDVGAVK